MEPAAEPELAVVVSVRKVGEHVVARPELALLKPLELAAEPLV